MSEPIRILNLFTIMNRGGAETMVMNYYRKIDKTKVQFDFMVHRQERGAYDDEIEAMGGHIYRMCPIYPQNIFRYKQLLKDFFDAHPEYRILHSHMSELGYFAFKEAVRHHVPVRICHAHNVPVFKSETWKERLKRFPREWLARQMRRLSTDYFACSEEAGLWLFGKSNKNKIVVVKNAIDSSLYTYVPTFEQNMRREFNWGNKFVIGHVGRFSPQKNHLFLIDIFYAIQCEIPNSILVLIGDGPLRRVIEEKVQHLNLGNKVFFLGFRKDLYKYYQCFDIFLFPSLYEGFGNVLIEAQACGVQCFTSKDVVPRHACISPLLHYVSLDRTALDWKNEIINYRHYVKSPNFYIRDSQFDIETNAEWLTQYYINRFKENA